MTHQPDELLWSTDSEICTLRQRNGGYELVLHRDGRLACVLAVDSEDAARALAHQWRLKHQRP